MPSRLGAVALAVSALAAVSASAGDGSTTLRNGPIVFAANRGDRPHFTVTDPRSGRSRDVKGTEGAEQPVLSPNGRFVAYAKDVGSSTPSLWVVKSDGTGRRRLTDGCEPTWAPSGRRLAFLRGTTQQAYCYAPELLVIDRDGSGLRGIYQGLIQSPRWSPAGDWIAFVLRNEVRHASDLYLIRPDGSAAHPVAQDVEPYGYDWSPDGRRLVYVAEDAAEQADLYTVPVQGVGATRITDDAHEEFDARWSADGRLIAFSSYPADGQSRTQVGVVDAAGGQVRFLGEGYRPAWSRDRRLAFFVTAGIMVSRPDGSHGRLAFRAALGVYYQSLAWLPRGRGLTFTRIVYDNGSALFAMREDGSDLRPLTLRRRAAVEPAVSPNGRLVAYARVRPAGNRELAVMRADGRNARRLTRNLYGWDQQPAWSPDGRRIVFVRSVSFTSTVLQVVRASGGRARVVWTGDRPYHPAWSPDGQSIAVDGVRNSKTRGIRVISLATGHVEEETHPAGYDVAADWSPDGTRLAFVRRETGHYTYERVWVATPATGEEHPITEFTPSANLRVRWSPDGTKLIAIKCLDPGFGYCVSAGIATMRPDGSGSKVVWSREGFYPLGLSWGPGPAR